VGDSELVAHFAPRVPPICNPKEGLRDDAEPAICVGQRIPAARALLDSHGIPNDADHLCNGDGEVDAAGR